MYLCETLSLSKPLPVWIWSNIIFSTLELLRTVPQTHKSVVQPQVGHMPVRFHNPTKRQEVPPIENLGLLSVINRRQPTCLPMGREWKPLSPWGEMVRLGMGRPLRTLPFLS